jgi:hypothetical protein
MKSGRIVSRLAEYSINNLKIRLVKQKPAFPVPTSAAEKVTSAMPDVKPSAVGTVKADRDVFRPQREDTLFWCLYTLLNDEHSYAMSEQSPFAEKSRSVIEMIKLVRDNKELLKAAKIKPSKIEEGLGEGNITPSIFTAIACIKSLPVALIEGNRYCETGESSDSKGWNLVRKQGKGDSWCIERDVKWADVCDMTKRRFRVPAGGVDGKYLKAIGGYGKADLEAMCVAFGLPVTRSVGGVEKACTKPQLYESLYTYISL